MNHRDPLSMSMAMAGVAPRALFLILSLQVERILCHDVVTGVDARENLCVRAIRRAQGHGLQGKAPM